MAVPQLSGQPTLRRAKPVAIIPGEHAPAFVEERLRVLPDAARGRADEVRSIAREPEGARRKANSAATIRGRGSVKRNERLRRETGRGKCDRYFVQGTRGQDRQVDRER